MAQCDDGLPRQQEVFAAASRPFDTMCSDSFRFTRELFSGDTARMNEVVRRLGEASSLDEAMAVFISTVRPDEENEATADFVELLKKYFS